MSLAHFTTSRISDLLFLILVEDFKGIHKFLLLFETENSIMSCISATSINGIDVGHLFVFLKLFSKINLILLHFFLCAYYLWVISMMMTFLLVIFNHFLYLVSRDMTTFLFSILIFLTNWAFTTPKNWHRWWLLTQFENTKEI